tara:strand:+ start:923 stop:1825 length:903 start_codon:yes stop_codon:yes gene_type:complete
MTINQKEIAIKKLIDNYSIETTPSIYEKIGSLKDLLPHTKDVYITYLPDENPEKIINTCKNIIEENLNAIPHLPARTIKNYDMLKKYICDLSEKAGCKNILVIGGSNKQNGNISSSLDVLQTDLLSKYNFKKVGLAGHPNGSADIPSEKLDEAIIEKNNFSKNADYKIYLVTQFFFDVKSFQAWENHITSLGNKLDIHAGIPGPANLKTLINFARSCGIENSINFLKKQSLNIRKLLTTSTPDKLIGDLADYKSNNPLSKLKKLHIYAFGGMRKSTKWMNEAIDYPLNIKTNNEFKTIIN